LEAGTLSIPEEETSNIDESSSEPPKYVNRILVDDICGAIVAAVKANNAAITVSAQSPSTSIPAVGGIYNLVDDDPAPRRHVVDEANRLVRSTFPNKTKRQTPSSSSSLAASSPPPIQSSFKRPTSRNTGNKRCKNQRLKDAFHWKLLAPTFREGLRICLESYDDVKR
jgi:nucleoside-diphosphate-sugar epimerase